MKDRIDEEFSKMILSVSGFRKVFAKDGVQGREREISEEDSLICTAIAKAFQSVVKPSCVLLARDARPTGSAICSVVFRSLQALGVKVCYAGICSAPEIMAESCLQDYDCFVYVSASHNPIGYNGLKFGKNGGVFANETAQKIIDCLKHEMEDKANIRSLYESALSIEVSEDEVLKKRCLADYSDFVTNTNFSQKHVFENIGVVADLNGSARCLSIDKEFLTEKGIKTCFINNVAGEIVHEIVPEGENLNQCGRFLEEVHKKDPDFVFGYVPDNDGDRGNLVYIDNEGKAGALKAQDVFAICVYSNILKCRKEGKSNLAVAVNGPTSMRIDDLCKKMGVFVFRGEVGEANIVSLGDELRKKGFCVPVSGEGSNGGNITHPAKVRDPLNTVISLCRLLEGGKTVPEILNMIPPYITTDSFDEEGIIRLQTKDWLNLKKEYLKLFEKCFESEKTKCHAFGLFRYEVIHTEGISERKGEIKTGKSGMKILFYDGENEKTAYIWMRPSGTEPLLRISADVKGLRKNLYEYLINLQRSLILEASEVLQHAQV